MFGKNWLNTATLTTVIRYALQAVGGVLIANGKLDAGQWETLSGAVLVIVPLILGVAATAKPKVVTKEAGMVSLKELGEAKKTYVEEAANVAVNKREPSFLERLFGKDK